jgi:pimeloyl-ACP methyl ester carboxylesterase
MYTSDIRETVPSVEVPVYFFSGIYDYTVNYSLAQDYLNTLNAPIKGFYLFNNSAHSPIFEEPEKVLQIVRENILNKK